MKLVLPQCPKAVLPSHKAVVVCLHCTLTFLIYTARKRAGDTFLHLFKGTRHPWLTHQNLSSWKIPGRAGAGNYSQSPKSIWGLQPRCPDWAALSWFHLLLTSLNAWPITECLHAPWGKLHFGKSPHTMWDFTRKNIKTNPSTRGRKKRRNHFNEKGSCSWLMSPCLESACFKNASRAWVMNTVILCELQISWELQTQCGGCAEKVNDLMGWNN